MVIGLQFFFKSLPLDGMPGKPQPTDSETIQPLTFGEILKLKEKLLQQEQQVSAASIAAAFASLQAQPGTTPLLVQDVEVADPEPSADATFQPSVNATGTSPLSAAAQPATARLIPTELSDPITQSSPSLQTGIAPQHAELSGTQLAQVTTIDTSAPSTMHFTKTDIPGDAAKTITGPVTANDSVGFTVNRSAPGVVTDDDIARGKKSVPATVAEPQNYSPIPAKATRSTVDFVEPNPEVNADEIGTPSVQKRVNEVAVKNDTSPSFPVHSNSSSDKPAIVIASENNGPDSVLSTSREGGSAPDENASFSSVTDQKRIAIASQQSDNHAAVGEKQSPSTAQAQTVKVTARTVPQVQPTRPATTYRSVQMDVAENAPLTQAETAEIQAARSVPVQQFAARTVETTESATPSEETVEPDLSSGGQIHQALPNTLTRKVTSAQPVEHQHSNTRSQPAAAGRGSVAPAVTESKTDEFTQPVLTTVKDAPPHTRSEVKQELNVEVKVSTPKMDKASVPASSSPLNSPVVRGIEPDGPSVKMAEVADDQTSEKIIQRDPKGPETDAATIARNLSKPAIQVDALVNDKDVETRDGAVAAPLTGKVEANSVAQVDVSAKPVFEPADLADQDLKKTSVGHDVHAEPASLDTLEFAQTPSHGSVIHEDEQSAPGMMVSVKPGETQPARRNAVRQVDAHVVVETRTLEKQDAQKAGSTVANPVAFQADRLAARPGDAGARNTPENFPTQVHGKIEPETEGSGTVTATSTPKADPAIERTAIPGNTGPEVQHSKQTAADVTPAEPSPVLKPTTEVPASRVDFEVVKSDPSHAARMGTNSGDSTQSLSVNPKLSRAMGQDDKKVPVAVKTADHVFASQRITIPATPGAKSTVEGMDTSNRSGTLSSDIDQPVQKMSGEVVKQDNVRSLPANAPEKTVEPVISGAKIPSGDLDQPARKVTSKVVKHEGKNALPDMRAGDETFAPEKVEFTPAAESKPAVEESVVSIAAGAQVPSSDQDRPVQKVTSGAEKQGREGSLPVDVSAKSTIPGNVEPATEEPVVAAAGRAQVFSSEIDQPLQRVTSEAVKPEGKNASPDMKTVDQAFVSQKVEFTSPANAGPVTEELVISRPAGSQVFFHNTVQSLHPMTHPVEQIGRDVPSDARVMDETFGSEKVQFVPGSKIEATAGEPVVAHAVRQETLPRDADQPAQKMEFTPRVEGRSAVEERVVPAVARPQTFPDDAAQPAQTTNESVKQAGKNASPDVKVVDKTFVSQKVEIASAANVEIKDKEPVVAHVIRPEIILDDAAEPVQKTASEVVKWNGETDLPDLEAVDEAIASENVRAVPLAEVEHPIEEAITPHVVRQETLPGDASRPVDKTLVAEPLVSAGTRPPAFSGVAQRTTSETVNRESKKTSADKRVIDDAFAPKRAEFISTTNAEPFAVRSQIFSSDTDRPVQRVTDEAVKRDGKSLLSADATVVAETVVSKTVEVIPGTEVETESKASVTSHAVRQETLPGDADRPAQKTVSEALEQESKKASPDVKLVDETFASKKMEFTARVEDKHAVEEPGVPTAAHPQTFSGDAGQPAQATTAEFMKQEGKDTSPDVKTIDKTFASPKVEIASAANVEIKDKEPVIAYAIRPEIILDDTAQPAQKTTSEAVKWKSENALPDLEVVDKAFASEKVQAVPLAEVEPPIEESVASHAIRQETHPGDAGRPVQKVNSEAVKQDSEGSLPVDTRTVDKTLDAEPLVSAGARPPAFPADAQRTTSEAVNWESKKTPADMRVIDESFASPKAEFTSTANTEPFAVRPQLFSSDTDRPVQKVTGETVKQESQNALPDVKAVDETFVSKRVEFASTTSVETAVEKPVAPAAAHPQIPSSAAGQSVQKMTVESAKQDNEQPDDGTVAGETFIFKKAEFASTVNVEPAIETPAAVRAQVFSRDTDQPVQQVKDEAVKQESKNAWPDMKLDDEVFAAGNEGSVPKAGVNPATEEPVVPAAVRLETRRDGQAQPVRNTSDTAMPQSGRTVVSNTGIIEDTFVSEEVLVAAPSRAEVSLEKPVLARTGGAQSATSDSGDIQVQEVNGVAAQKAERPPHKSPNGREDMLSVSQTVVDDRKSEMPKVSIDGKEVIGTFEVTEVKAETVQPKVGQKGFGIEKEKAMPGSTVASVAVQEVAVSETNIEPEIKVESSPVLAPETKRGFSHSETLVHERTIVLETGDQEADISQVQTKVFVAEAASSTAYGDDAQNAETGTIATERMYTPVPRSETTETRVPDKVTAFVEPEIHEKLNSVDVPLTPVEHTGTVDAKAAGPRPVFVEREESSNTRHVPMVETHKPVPREFEASSAGTVIGIETKEEIRTKPIIRDEELRLGEKRTELNQMPGSVAQPAGPVNEAKTAEFNEKMPVEQVHAQAVEVAQQVIRQMKVSIKSGSTSMHLKLNPKELGAIDVDMVSNAQGVYVTFFAEQASTGRLLETQLSQLRDALVDSGVQLSGLNISQHNTQGQKGGTFSHDTDFAPFTRQNFAERDDNRRDAPAERSIGQSSEIDYRV